MQCLCAHLQDMAEHADPVQPKRVCCRHMLRTVLALQLGWASLVGALDVSPGDPDWKSSVEAAPSGTTIFFLPGVYHGCNVSVPAGAQDIAKSCV